MDDVNLWSKKLLLISAIITIFVLAFILSRISPETRGVKIFGPRQTASKILNDHSSASSGLGAAQEANAAAADEQYSKAMQCTDGDALVSLGRK